jgi:TolA-binding protein
MPTESDAAGGAATAKDDPPNYTPVTMSYFNAVMAAYQQQFYKLQEQVEQADGNTGQYVQQEVGRVQTLLQGQITGLGQQIAQLEQQIAALQRSSQGDNVAQQLQSLAQRVSALEQAQRGGGGGGSTPAQPAFTQGRAMLVALGDETAAAWASLPWQPSRVSTSPACQVRIYGTNVQTILRGGRTGQPVSWTAYR